MKRSKLMILTSCSLLIGCSQTAVDNTNISSTPSTLNDATADYLNVVSRFEHVSDTFLLDTHQNVFLFLGRVTCPYCQQFASQLLFVDTSKYKVYYLDTQKYKESHILQEFANINRIEGVPSFLSFDGQGNITQYNFDKPLIDFLNEQFTH